MSLAGRTWSAARAWCSPLNVDRELPRANSREKRNGFRTFTAEAEDGEGENFDDCEEDEDADDKGEEGDKGGKGGKGDRCMMDDLMGDFEGRPRGGSSGIMGGAHGGGEPSGPGPNDGGGDDPPGQPGSGNDNGKEQGQPDADDEPSGSPGNGDPSRDENNAGAPTDGPVAGDPSGAEGDDGDNGGGDEGDGGSDQEGGESDGHVNTNCQSAGADAEPPPGLNPNPLGGSEGVNPGFLNPGVVLKYRSVQKTEHYTGIGWDANVFERLVVNPTRNPAALVAWYPGTGAVHYFYAGPAGSINLIPEPAIQDTHTMQVDATPGAPYKYILIDKHGNKSKFSESGVLGLKEDVFGATNAYTRDPVTLRLQSISSSYGHSSLYSFEYHATGRLASMTDFSGRVTTFSYDASAHLSRIAFPASTLHPTGKQFHYNYYQGTGNPLVDGLMKEIVDPNGDKRVEWVYDANGKVVELSRGNGMHALTLSASGNTRDVTDFNGNLRRYTFQPGLHYPTRIELFTRGLRQGDPASYVWQYAYTAQRQIAQAVMPDGKTYSYTYDSNFNLSQKAIAGPGGGQSAIYTWTHDSLNHPLSYTDPLGQTWNYVRDSKGMLLSVQPPTITGESYNFQWTYNSVGQTTSVLNSNGASLHLQRYASGPHKGWLKTATLTSPEGQSCDPGGLSMTYSFTHNERGWPMTMTDPLGNTVGYERDALDRVVKAYANGTVPSVQTVQYNNLGLPQSTKVENRDQNGVLDPIAGEIGRYFTHDARRRVIGVTEDFAVGQTRSFVLERDGLGNATSLTSPTGRVSQQAWDERGLPLSLTSGLASPLKFTYAYHPNGRMSSVADPVGNAYLYGLDAFGRQNSVTSPTGETHARTLDLLGRTTETTLRDASGVLAARHTYAYDPRNRPTSTSYDVFRPGGPTQTATLSVEYDSAGNVTKAIAPTGLSYSNTYLPCGRLLSSTNDVTESRLDYTYDQRGLLTRVKRTETEGGVTKVYVTEADHDYMGRVYETREFDADNPAHVLTSNYRYDSRGNLREHLGATGTTTRYEYNLAGYLVKKEELENPGEPNQSVHTTTYAWSRDGQILSVTDPANATTAYAYDEHGRLGAVTMPDQSQVTYAYDAAGRLSSTTDANGTTVMNGYDAAGRLTDRTIGRGSGVLGTTIETYAYDSVGRLVSAADDDSVVELDYDSIGNVIEERQGPSPGSLTSVKATYDVEQRLTQLQYPTMTMLDFSQDSAGRLSSISMNGGSNLFSRAYARTVLPVSQTMLGAGAVETRGFDGFDRLTSFAFHTQGGAVNFSAEYAYNDAHQRVYERRVHQGNVGELYFYDQRHRVSGVLRGVADPAAELAAPGTQAVAAVATYNYDAVGARVQTSVVPTGGSPTITSYASNNLHQYTVVGGTTRAYDAAGNLVADGVHTFSYDYRGQLVEVRSQATGTTVAGYSYDALGRRTLKTVLSVPPTPPLVQQYLYSGFDLIEVRDGSGAMTHQYVHATGVDDAVLLHALDANDVNGNGVTNEYLWFGLHRDARNSVRAVTDAAGNVVERYDYEEFGTTTITNAAGVTIASSLVNNFLTFTGREHDAETGLMYYRARHYDPVTGSFMQRDPLGFVDGPNLYTYVQNDPFSRLDPFGTDDVGGGFWSGVGDFFEGIGGTVHDGVDSALGTKTRVSRANKIVTGVAASVFVVAGGIATGGALWAKAGGAVGVKAGLATAGTSVVNAVGTTTARIGATAAIALAHAQQACRGAPAMPSRPPLPSGFKTLAEFGKAMKWGRGIKEPISQIPHLTRAGLEKIGMTRELAGSWAKFYDGVVKATPKNPSAAGRAQLMRAAEKALK